MASGSASAPQPEPDGERGVPPGDPPRTLRRAAADLLRAWFELTPSEQKAVAVILSLFLLGLAVRLWHVTRAAWNE
jgi:hypothetical protein